MDAFERNFYPNEWISRQRSCTHNENSIVNWESHYMTTENACSSISIEHASLWSLPPSIHPSYNYVGARRSLALHQNRVEERDRWLTTSESARHLHIKLFIPRKVSFSPTYSDQALRPLLFILHVSHLYAFFVTYLHRGSSSRIMLLM